MTGDELFALIVQRLGPEAHRHLGIDAPARRDTAIAGGSYRSPGMLVDGFRAGDGDRIVSGVVVAARASLAVLERAKEVGANLVISRQAFLDDSRDRPVAQPEPALADKLRFIAENGLAVLRLQDPRTAPLGRAITGALPTAIGLGPPPASGDPAAGLLYRVPGTSVAALARKIAAQVPGARMRLVGDPAMAVTGMALATETSRPNALNPLLALPHVNLLIAGEVHETETTAYVLDAIAMGQRKALLLVGSIALEEAPAAALARWLAGVVPVKVAYVSAPEGLWQA